MTLFIKENFDWWLFEVNLLEGRANNLKDLTKLKVADINTGAKQMITTVSIHIIPRILKPVAHNHHKKREEVAVPPPPKKNLQLLRLLNV